MSLVPEALVVVIFDELIAQQDLARLWRLMAHFSDQIYSRISTDHDDAARRVELAVFQVRPGVQLAAHAWHTAMASGRGMGCERL